MSEDSTIRTPQYGISNGPDHQEPPDDEPAWGPPDEWDDEPSWGPSDDESPWGPSDDGSAPATEEAQPATTAGTPPPSQPTIAPQPEKAPETAQEPDKAPDATPEVTPEPKPSSTAEAAPAPEPSGSKPSSTAEAAPAPEPSGSKPSEAPEPNTRIFIDPRPWVWTPESRDEPYQVQTYKTRTEHETLNEVSAIMSRRFGGELFLHDEKLVRVREGKLKPLSARAFGALAGGQVSYLEPGGKVLHLPPLYAEHLHSRAREYFPPLRAVLTAPFMTSDFGIASASGYYPEQQILLVAPEIPTLTQEEALEALRELLGDFTFANSNAVLGALALYLEPYTLVAVKGPSPMHVVGAKRQRSGKTTLAAGSGVLALGRVPPAYGLPRSAIELPYTIAANLQEPAAYLMLDNLPDGYRLDSPDLERLITARGPVKLRPARSGGNLSADLTLTTLVGTCNTPAVAGGMARRVSHIGLLPQPTGKQYKLYPFEVAVSRDRPRYLAAMVAIIRAWRDSGCTRPGNRWDSFPEWSAIVPGVVSVAAAGFGLDMTHVETWLDHMNAQVPDDECDWAELTKNWPAQNGQAIWCQATMLLEVIDGLSLPVLTARLGYGSERSRQIKLGNMLTGRARAGLVAGGCVILKRRCGNTSEYVIGSVE